MGGTTAVSGPRKVRFSREAPRSVFLVDIQQLETAAAQAGLAQAVRAAALHYLEAGQLPQRVAHSVSGADIPAWPLTETGIPPAGSQDEAKPLRRHPLPFPQVGSSGVC